MPYCIYILRLQNSQLYVGSTDNLNRRLGEHLSGFGGRTTALSGPPELLYSEPQPDHSSALKRENQIKGWTHAKKLALIQGDLEQLKKLARSHSVANARLSE